MKNSFFLVIPEQHKNPELLAAYEITAIEQWVSELPAANLSLATRLFHDFIEKLNAVDIPAQQRIDILEIIRPQFIVIEDYLRSRLILSGFPKGENEQKIFELIVLIEKNISTGYWIVVRELTRRDVGWFKGKNTALAIQRTIRGLSEIVVTHYMMYLSVPDWVWIDLHSLYKLSVRLKKEASKVSDVTCVAAKVSTIENCYKQILLLSLSDPSGLMQKEMRLVYDFIGKISQYIQIAERPVKGQESQCVVLMDEDTGPFFDNDSHQADSAMMYFDLLKLHKILIQRDKFSSKDEARFNSMRHITKESEKLPVDLYDFLLQSWKGIEVLGTKFFTDRLDRCIATGLYATHELQGSLNVGEEEVQLEQLAESYSETALSCKFENEGALSIGSLVSFRKTNEQESKRTLSIVKKISMPKKDGSIVFELDALTPLSYAVSYKSKDEEEENDHQRALLYGVKNNGGDRSYIIFESFMHKDGDIMRLFMNSSDFPIILGDRKNIGLGYWQFECRQIEEKQVPETNKKKGYDFI